MPTGSMHDGSLADVIEPDDDINARVARQFDRVVGRLGQRDLTPEEARLNDPLPGSPLAVDDSKTSFDPISFQAHFYLTVAQDHLSTIREFLEEVGRIPPTSLYSITRSAIESAAYGIWLLSGGTRAKRVKRSLLLSYDAQWSVVDIARATGSEFDPTLAYTELEQIKRATKGIDNGADLSSMPTISDILREVDRYVAIEPASGLDAWRICSGITHANRWVANAISESVAVPGRATEQRMEASFAMLTTVLIAAVELRDQLRKRIREAGGHG